MTPELVFRSVAAMAGIGAAISAIEYLAILPQFADDAIFGWRVFSTKYPPPRFAAVGVVRDRLFAPGGVRAMMLIRAAAALLMMIPFCPVGIVGAAAAVVLATGAAMTYRCGFGEDGSDQMLVIVAAGLLAYAIVPAGSAWRPMGLWFIAGQAVLSYGAAGIAKLASPAWRSGDASLLIFRTATYSFERLALALRASRALRHALAWTTIAFECLFPLAIFAPRPVMIAFLAAGVLFHVFNAAVMGLNVFFWAFVSTYPAVLLLRDTIASHTLRGA